ncbi:MAG: 16S rRNA (uracil(1498)-N(3))-methyltransferase [Syntrophales bacterium]|nr:16S rRNA (uracil(1498)-N(3))-methyltransferase [Syntrophales bacterium]MDD4339870.1 16S rRNA (uracil(1498)-N(3))-methyltransferase [Syntrophales bacterium]HOG06525.1 16S rRNA (uracil(1498)-N(3))-methyltransferase [Syntrophales bacterium]HPB69952.1 16S rRNA (uracil(1498)-N(3))-methyltransferase [Syntrophales bacterium]HQN25106.1 16S rRNA (uracil(1498)-N(3))-methyltransferase [Syntrophales bacterium]
MTAPRIYYPHPFAVGETCVLDGNWRRYLRTVLRLREGDALVLFDGQGREGRAHMTGIDRDGVSVQVGVCRVVPADALPLTLAQALPKGETMEAVIRKATELGVTAIRPFPSERSIPRLTAEKARQRVARWQTVAVEACRQSRRADIPRVEDIASFEDIVAAPEDGAVRLMLWEEERETGLRNLLRGLTDLKGRPCTVVIGPEGGFTEAEVRLAKGHGFLIASLGRRVLKVETAAVAALAIVQYERETLGTAEKGNDGT